MNISRTEAEAKAREVIASTFVVTNVGSFYDEKDEEDAEIKLSDVQGDDVVKVGPTAPDEAGVYYVTMSFDNVSGDGNFRATARVTENEAAVVDFEALP